MQKLDSNIDDFYAEHCGVTVDVALGSTPAQLMKAMRFHDEELRAEKELEKRLRNKWHFVSPQNRHRVKLSWTSVEFIRLNSSA